MIKSRYTSALCIAIVCLMLLIAVLFTCGGALGMTVSASTMPYEQGLFATDRVHTMDIVVDKDAWQDMLDNASAKEYIPVTLVIDNNAVKNVGLRTKGNSSLTSIVSSESDRYSFKVEFDHYVTGLSYQGLDKLALNNIAQDYTYLKDYISYQLMGTFGADAPLCSFIYITVNGEEWGLYLAVEGIEESFAERNYGSDYGQIYKPDSMNMAGGMGGGNMPDMSDMEDMFSMFANGEMPDFSGFGESGGMMFPGSTDADTQGETDTAGDTEDGMPDTGTNGFTMPGGAEQGRGGMGGMGGSDDVALQYIDDAYDSYSNIFDNAAFSITDSDKDRLIDTLHQLNDGENLEEIVNIEEVLRYFVVHNFVLNFDSYTGSMTHNYYLYEDGGQLSMIAWDYNLAFGAFAMGGFGGSGNSGTDQSTTMANYPIDTPVSGIQMEDRPLLYQLLSDETYLEQYHQLFSEFIQTYFDGGRFYEIYENAYALIKPYVEKDPSSFCTYEAFITAADMLEEFCTLRAKSVAGQLDGSIPSTSDGQAEDNSGFIDASGIDIESMGSNSMGFDRARGSFGGGDGESFRQRPDTGSIPGGDATDDAHLEDAEPNGNTADGDLLSEGDTAVPAQNLSFSDHTRVISTLTASSGIESGILFSAAQGGGRGMTEGGNAAGEPPGGDGQIPGGMPDGMEGFSPENLPEGFNREDLPEGFTPGDFPGGDTNGDIPEAGGDGTAGQDAPPQTADGTQPGTGENGDAEGNGFDIQNFSNLLGGGRGTASTQKSETEQYIWLGVSVLILGAGLLAAKLYRV